MKLLSFKIIFNESYFKYHLSCCLSIINIESVDPLTPMAGGTAKFLGPVVLSNDGINIWSSPVSLKASCDMEVSAWPFDSQTCSLQFGSMSQGLGELQLHSYDDQHKAGNFIVRSPNASHPRVVLTTTPKNSQGMKPKGNGVRGRAEPFVLPSSIFLRFYKGF